MACRIRNTGKHLLQLDLRNGETLHLRPGETSPPLREELLYANTYLADWEARGLAARLPASMREVLAIEGHAVETAPPAEGEPPVAEGGESAGPAAGRRSERRRTREDG